jgi:hypothetical protein
MSVFQNKMFLKYGKFKIMLFLQKNVYLKKKKIYIYIYLELFKRKQGFTRIKP